MGVAVSLGCDMFPPKSLYGKKSIEGVGHNVMMKSVRG